MDQAIQFLLRHGYAALFVFVLAEQIGLPIPAVPILLAVGALAGAGRFSLMAVILTAVLASLVGDLLWYELGRRRGRSVLKQVCRISLEPDSCVRRAEEALSRHGVRLLLFAKFVPGLSMATPPLVATFRMSLRRFVVWDSLGAVLWAGAFSGAGYLFHAQLERIGAVALRLGAGSIALLATALGFYVARKYVERRRMLRQLLMARITPEELMRKLEAGEDVVVADLRHPLDFEADAVKVPGALRLLPEELDRRHPEIPRDRDVVLYCSCPNEATSARVALELRRHGVTRVRPLTGGFEAWRAGGFPLESTTPTDAGRTSRERPFGVTTPSSQREG
ncbi:MAG: VTT domain-containing protein [Acidobacteria bacterium]|nr:VTT domain-containing protein [Acidobacteriota bacterium]